LKGGILGSNTHPNFRYSRFIAPSLRGEFVRKISRFAHCGIDISDGVYTEINRLSIINRIGIRLFKQSSSFFSGEEYEMLIGINRRDKRRALRIARAMRVEIRFIGEAYKKVKRYKARLWHA